MRVRLLLGIGSSDVVLNGRVTLDYSHVLCILKIRKKDIKSFNNYEIINLCGDMFNPDVNITCNM